MSFTQEDLNKMRWDHFQKVTFLKNEMIITFRSGARLTANPPDYKTHLQFYQEAKRRLKEEQIEIGDLPDENH
jgi:hypothetical protein